MAIIVKSLPLCYGLNWCNEIITFKPCDDTCSFFNEASLHDYCVIGAGPAGLQMAYYLSMAKRDYVVFERSNISGFFFSIYPRHRRLISINKRFTGRTNKEFNLRHDWNSLLSHDQQLVFREYSSEFFPNADDMVRYLNDFQRKLAIRVQYNTDIRNVTRVWNDVDKVHRFSMRDQRNLTYSCNTVIVSTGLWLLNAPEFPGSRLVEGYETVDIDPKLFEGQNVLILGRGNSAFETADALYGRTNLIHMVSRSRARLSWSTHYVGDLRAINNGLLDTYQLKSLDGLLEAPVEDMELEKKSDGRIHVKFPSFERQVHSPTSESDLDNFSLREGYHHVIRCLGFNFDDSLFDKDILPIKGHGRKAKYPAIKQNLESFSVPGLYFAGTITHSLDYRKSAGGFIHGFRYTVRMLHKLLEYRNHNVQWPSYRQSIVDLLNTIVKRINEAAGLYQMFGSLADIILLQKNNTEFEVLEEFPVQLLHQLPKLTGHLVDKFFVIIMEYGPDFSGPDKDTFRPDRATGDPLEAHRSNFLHPVFYFYTKLPTEAEMSSKPPNWILPRPQRLHHVLEDFLTTWTAPQSHILPLRRFLEYCIGNDLRQLMFATFPHTCPCKFNLRQPSQQQNASNFPRLIWICYEGSKRDI
uniref:FAD-dependent oxidoreductase domain-containing protein 2 n=1 Tax=Strigamia maritima TaxID=126957 RepID=T1JNK9_STRMM